MLRDIKLLQIFPLSLAEETKMGKRCTESGKADKKRQNVLCIIIIVVNENREP